MSNNKGLMSWLIGKVEKYLVKQVNNIYNLKMGRLTDSKGFREVSDNYAGKDASKKQKDAMHKKMADMAKNDPKKLHKIMTYDVRKSNLRKFDI
jgi:hypothetical protein